MGYFFPGGTVKILLDLSGIYFFSARDELRALEKGGGEK